MLIDETTSVENAEVEIADSGKPPGKKNSNLTAAKRAKNDEFYTRIEDIQNEIQHYASHFEGKTVFCNCDDPIWSNFWVFFHDCFDRLKLKRLVATYYTKNGKSAGKLVCHDEKRDAAGKPEVLTYDLQGDGDFRSPECVALLKDADIVCTNPPFSLFREYIAQLMEHGKRFLIVGDMNAITYKEVFPLIRANKVWLGVSTPKRFRTERDQEVYQQFGNKCWFTNLTHEQRNTDIPLFRSIKDKDVRYDRFDNYDAINVNKTQDIPCDFDGAMGVPISFLSKYNPEQFEIIGITKTWDKLAIKTYGKQIQVDTSGTRKEVSKLNDGPAIRMDKAPQGSTYYTVDGVAFVQAYARIVVRRKSR